MTDKKECKHPVKIHNHLTHEIFCADCGNKILKDKQPDNATLLQAIESLTEQVQCLRALVEMPKQITCMKCGGRGKKHITTEFGGREVPCEACSGCGHHKIEVCNETKED